MDKEKTKQQIKILVEKYQKEKATGKLKSYTEQQTKNDFIEPLFEALGWDMRNIKNNREVSMEENISGKRADYGFYLNGRAKFYLEAKSFCVNIDDENFANQSVRYSWNKGITWAILTNFQKIIVFCAQEIDKRLSDKEFFEISCEDYLERFDQLWWLSKESFEKNVLDKEAEKVGKVLQRKPISQLLYEDLNECREILTEGLSAWNSKLFNSDNNDLLDEGVQKILDRLIFLKVAEDRGVEPDTLKSLLRESSADQRKTGISVFDAMIAKFRELDEVYNSNLFSKHNFETWECYGNEIKEVVEKLNGKKGYYEYDFKIMPADVLGSVYENYLGYKLAQSKKGVKVEKDVKKRKEQGIFYTPSFVVDYIVKNALKPVLDKCKSIGDLKKIKVLDPSCGSGSFLIKALEVINEKYMEFGNPGNEFTKLEIILNNIYGVDLDNQAVEIARLNLLINALDTRMKMPPLSENIKNGNSLISGTDEELKKYFGDNFRDKKPFDWQKEFPKVFEQGGFDVIIGNPPWGANIDDDIKYYSAKYPNSTKSHKDIYKIFIDKGISLLREGGGLGFIVPNTFLYQPRYEDIKEVINKNENFVINLGEHIFHNVQLPSCILIIEKKNGTNKFVADLTKENRETLGEAIRNINTSSIQTIIAGTNEIVKNTGVVFDDVFLLKDAGVKHQRVDVGKGEKGKNDLRERIYYHDGIKNKNDHPLFTGSDINRYTILSQPSFFLIDDYKNLLNDDEIVYFDKLMMNKEIKIVWRQTADKIRAVIINNEWFANTLQVATIKDDWAKKIDIYYALAIFNSKYLDYLYRQKVMETGKVFPQVKLRYLRDMPFVIAPEKTQKTISDLAKKMTSLNKEIHETPENTDKWDSIKSEIENTDKKIDEEVYKIYKLTPEEIEIVEI